MRRGGGRRRAREAPASGRRSAAADGPPRRRALRRPSCRPASRPRRARREATHDEHADARRERAIRAGAPPGVRGGTGSRPLGCVRHDGETIRRAARTASAGPVIAAPLPDSRDPSPMPDDRSAAALLREVGLMADGPALWGQPVRHGGPGVFVVELPAPVAVAAAGPRARRQVARARARAAPRRRAARRRKDLQRASRRSGCRRSRCCSSARRPGSVAAGVARIAKTVPGDRKPAWLRVLAPLPAERRRPARLVGGHRCARGVRGRAARRLRRRACPPPSAPALPDGIGGPAVGRPARSPSGGRKATGIANPLLPEVKAPEPRP